MEYILQIMTWLKTIFQFLESIFGNFFTQTGDLINILGMLGDGNIDHLDTDCYRHIW